jgi:hypothetical protein
MSDILTDYREWRASLEDRIGTHSPGCHMWPRHERCMIHRLAAEIERLRLAIRRLAEQDATLSVVGGSVIVQMDETLTDAEREAIEYAADAYDYKAADAYAHNEDDARYKHIAATLRGLLERTNPHGNKTTK